MTRSNKENPNMPTSVELEKFSDVEDAELNKYILNTKERRFKTAIWELINRDYHKVATSAPQQSKDPADPYQDTRNSDKRKKRKRDQDDDISNQGEALPDKLYPELIPTITEAVQQDAKQKKVESSVANDPGEDIVEFTFNDEEEY